MKNKILQSLVLVACSLTLMSCSSVKSTNKESLKTISNSNSEDQNVEMLNYRRTSCLGRCPVYSFKIFKDASCEIDGKLFFVVEGEHEGNISQEQYDEIVQKINDIDFFNLKDSYDNPMVQDIPETYITINLNGKSKSIVSRYKSPTELVNFLTHIHELAKVVKWVKSLDK